MRKLFLVLLLLCSTLSLWATHQRAAEITYEWKGGNTYEFTMTCYTYTPSPAGLQRDSLLMMWGDGFGDYAPRVVLQDLGDNYTLNVYRITHDYAAAGSYVISMEDPDRNYGVVNIPNSVSIPMYIETELVISPFLGYNNSVQLLNPPVDRGCVGKPFYHNPAAYDPDGDSLSYRLVPCKGNFGEEIPGYTYPQASSLFDIDPVTGELHWENPVLQGEYNIAILIEEWRHGVKIGSVIRDMQILVNACDNDIPDIVCVTDTCVVAGSTLEFVISGSDPDGDQVTLSASGGPFELADSPATLTPSTASGLEPSFTFSWTAQCGHIRKAPYQVVVHAKDDAFPIALTNVQNINIHVLGPAVEGLVAESDGSSVTLSWQPYACPNAEKLRVYRKIDAWPYVPEACETGVRPGYQKIAELEPDALAFVDSNTGAGFNQGVDYCYRVVAVFHGDCEGVPSEEACAHLENNLPLMTQVSNDSADLAGGRVFVRWAAPREINPQYQGPYSYRLFRAMDGTDAELYSGSDSLFCDEHANLSSVQTLSYRVEMRDVAQQLVGTSAPAEAVMLTGTGGDEKALLTWTENVPWTIDSTEVFKETDRGFVKIGASLTMNFTDTEVENDIEYRYYVRTFGHYALEGLPRPLVNWSAIIAVTPTDDEAPLPPAIEVETDCEAVSNIITWTGEFESDLAGFKVYFKAPSEPSFGLVATVENPAATSFRHEEMASVLGCYFVRSYDENGNLSQPSDTVCVDQDACPVYELPNVFTPNSDGFNDVFKPIHAQLSVITSFKIVIFNRWGNILHDTDDPLIQWDGKNRHTHLDCPPGTYFFVCDLTYLGLTGPESMHLQGSITLLR